MTDDVDHIFLTRFNLPSVGVESLIRAEEGWLRDRVALFERYTVPSVQSQTAACRWLVYFDPDSPSWLVDRLRPHVEAGVFRAIYREVVTPTEVIADARDLVGQPASFLLTTNLDNDDGLSADFARVLRDAASSPGRHAVYLTAGLIRSPQGLYLRQDRHNAFCSVWEPWDEPKTCWADWHNLLSQHMPVREVAVAPTWLQVVHGKNVSNRVRGRRVSAESYRDRFGGLLDDVPEPRMQDRIGDLVVGRPARFLRDSGRSGLKNLALRLVGKQGLDALKLRLSQARSALPGRRS